MFNTSRVSLPFLSSHNLPFGCREIFPFSVVCFPEEVTEKKKWKFFFFLFCFPFCSSFLGSQTGLYGSWCMWDSGALRICWLLQILKFLFLLYNYFTRNPVIFILLYKLMYAFLFSWQMEALYSKLYDKYTKLKVSQLFTFLSIPLALWKLTNVTLFICLVSIYVIMLCLVTENFVRLDCLKSFNILYFWFLRIWETNLVGNWFFTIFMN